MYNVRIIEYANGSIQIRLYSKPLADKDYCGQLLDKVREPFSGKVVTDIDREDDSQRESIQRSRRMMSMYARAIKWDWFVTLTFAPDRTDRYDYRTCSRKLMNWLKYLRKTKAPDIKYLLVYEPHVDGAWHIHGLMADAGGLDFFDSGHIRSGRTVYNLTDWRYGYTACTCVQDTYRVSAYIVKYLVKTDIRLDRWQHRYIVSRNLPCPVQTLYCVDPDNINGWVQSYADQIGYRIVWKSQSNGAYVHTTYFDLVADSDPNN